MALNNLGAAEIRLGEVDPGRGHLDQAIRLDPLCPLPFYNLGLLAEAEGDAEEAGRCFATAARLGYARGRSDGIVIRSQTRFAERSGG